MTPIDVKVRIDHRVNPDGFVTRRGWDVGIPGLVIEESRTTTGKRCWGIVHQPSSCTVMGNGFTSPEMAVACAHALAAGTDWTRSGLDLMDDPNVRPMVRQVMAEFDWDVAPGELAGVVDRRDLAVS